MEDFVPYELAVKLKEKGFREKCFAFYYRQGGFQWNYMRADTGLVNVSWACLNYNDIINGDKINAPTISQVLKWLREKKRIEVGAVWGNRVDKWIGYVNEMDMPDLVGEYVLPNNNYDSYELAALAGIEYVIDNLI